MITRPSTSSFLPPLVKNLYAPKKSRPQPDKETITNCKSIHTIKTIFQHHLPNNFCCIENSSDYDFQRKNAQINLVMIQLSQDFLEQLPSKPHPILILSNFRVIIFKTERLQEEKERTDRARVKSLQDLQNNIRNKALT